jgi:hypothetical protein
MTSIRFIRRGPSLLSYLLGTTSFLFDVLMMITYASINREAKSDKQEILN